MKCLYRRDRANMPDPGREVGHAEEEGVEFVWLAAPEAFHGDIDGGVTAVRAARIHLSVPDASAGRRRASSMAQTSTCLAGLAILALGFEPRRRPGALRRARARGVARWNGDDRPPTMMTSIDGVFAAGDIVRGASLVVWAIRDGGTRPSRSITTSGRRRIAPVAAEWRHSMGTLDGRVDVVRPPWPLSGGTLRI